MYKNSKTALILIDIQEGLDEVAYYGGQRNNLHAEDNCGKILAECRAIQIPIIHVKHNSTNQDSPLHPNSSGNRIKAVVTPIDEEMVIQKQVNSAFVDTGLKEKLEEIGVEKVILIGLTAEHCVSSTARMAANLGFEVIVVSDATAAFCKTSTGGEFFDAEIIHKTTMATLKDEFAEIMDTSRLIRHLSNL